jgi:hypothetical protein
MRSPAGLGLIATFMLALVGCPSGNQPDNVNANINSSPPALYPATWQRTSGTIFGRGARELTHLVLNDDSTAEFHFRHAEAGFTTCTGALFEQSAGMLRVAMAVPEHSLALITYDLLDADTLQLTDVNGDQGVFTRTTLPAGVECLPLTVLNTYAGLPRPDVWTGLAYDTTQFWYTNSDRLAQGISLTGAPTTTLDLTVRFVHAYQGDAFWLTAQAAAGITVERRNHLNVLLDVVDTAALGAPTQIAALAYDETGDVLWLQGWVEETGDHRFLRVDSAAEPDVLLGTDDFDVDVDAMAFGGGSLWALIDIERYIIQLDPATLTPLQTYIAPDFATWHGLAWVEGALYLIGSDASGGVLIQTQP